MADSYTPNKGLILQQTGGDIGSWGANLNNDVISILDNNLGGNLTKSVAGNFDVTLTSTEAENLYYNFTGVLTGNINVIWPSGAGSYIIANNTTGAYTLTIKPTGGTGVVISQGTVQEIFISTNTGTAFLTYNTIISSVSPTFTGTISGVNETLSGTLGITGTITAAAINATNVSASGTLSATGHTTFEGVTSTGATGTGNLVYSASPIFTGTVTAAAMNVSGLTASELVATDGSKNLTNITALPNGTTATTQSAGDASTKVATTSYVDRGASGASWVLLASHIASNSASITFTSNLSSSYDDYMLVWDNHVAASNSTQLGLYLSTDNGSTYISSGILWNVFGSTNDGNVNIANNNDGKFIFADTGSHPQGNISGLTGSGQVMLGNVNASGTVNLTGIVTYAISSTSVGSITVGGMAVHSGAITAIKLQESSGNISSGNFYLYGIRKS